MTFGSIKIWLGSANLKEGEKRLISLSLSLVAIWVIFFIFTDGLFLTPRNFYNLAVQSSVVGILAVGMVLVIISKNIDLSVGSVLGFTGMTIAYLQIEILPVEASWNWPVTVIFAILLGTLIGFWQGFLVAYVAIPSFVVTLAGLLIFRGAAFEVAKGRTLSPFQDDYRIFGGGIHGSFGEDLSWLICSLGILIILVVNGLIFKRTGKLNYRTILISILGSVFFVFCVYMFNIYDRPRSDIGHGIPSPLLALTLAVIFGSILLRKMPFGRHLLAVGKHLEHVRLVGVPTERVTMRAFALMGALCAVGAIITTSRLNAGTNNLGTLLELNVIAAAVIGGASLDGGRGSILGGLLGALIIQSLDTGLVLLGVSSSMRQILIGFVLIMAVWFDTAGRRKA